MNKEQSTKQNISKEIKTPGYLGRAHQRAQRRRSPWNLILIPLSISGMGGFTYLMFQMMWKVHTTIHPDHAGKLSEFWGKGISFTSFISSFLLMMPLLFASIPLGLMLANCIAWCILPARRAFNREAENVKWASFRESMQGLWAFAKFLVPICLLLSLVGAITLNNLK